MAMAMCCASVGVAEARPAVECQVRQGLPNFFRLAESGSRPIRVGYFGGSITAAEGWRVQSLQWLRQQFPKAEFQEIHGAISGTNSTLGAFRLQRDMLSHKPDLFYLLFIIHNWRFSIYSLLFHFRKLLHKRNTYNLLTIRLHKYQNSSHFQNHRLSHSHLDQLIFHMYQSHLPSKLHKNLLSVPRM